MVRIQKEPFGKTQNGRQVYCFTLKNARGMQAEILNYGGAVRTLLVPDKNGVFTDVVLGYDNINAYERQDKYLGCVIGRVCNRIENARFALNGREYTLYRNSGANHLHGGKEGFDKKLFEASIEKDALLLTYKSPDGEEGYPGNLELCVRYTIDNDNTLWISYSAKSDKDTLFSPTNHTYFNLDGHRAPSVAQQQIKLHADYFTQTNAQSVPTGRLLAVAGTPLDLRSYTAIGRHIDDAYPQLAGCGGYDHNFAVRSYDKTRREAANAYSAQTGILLTMYTDLPGMQFYTGNYLEDMPLGKEETVYRKRSGFCLESQFFPNAIHLASFEAPVLKAGQSMQTTTGYGFTVKE